VAQADIDRVLSAAIAECRRVELRYMDDAQTRVFEPYVIHVLCGVHRVVSGVQVSHPSAPDMANSWGCLDLAEICDVKVQDTAFRPHKGFSSYAVERYQQVTAAVDRASDA